MQVALLTVGDELLAGDTQNTNATWLAGQLADRGATVARILVVPDDRDLIAHKVSDFVGSFDAVIVTGGLGGTPDDVTMAAVAQAFDRPLAPDDRALADVEATVETVHEEFPDIDLDHEAEASIPDGSRALLNDPGLAPGCVIETVHVLPGVPDEMKAMFASVAESFGGDVESRTFHTATPEADLVADLETAGERFDVAVGCYPDPAVRHNRIKLTGEEPAELDRAAEWLKTRVAVTTPAE
jgi:molybdenum cofactor synthesis domain-containing protein